LRRDRPDPTPRGSNEYPLDGHRDTAVLQGRDERLSGTQGGDDGRHVEGRIRWKGLCRRSYRFLITRRVGAERMLDPIAELAEDLARHVVGKLRAEVDADPFGPDEPNHLLDALPERRRRIIEKQMSLIEEEDQLRLLHVPYFR